MAEGYINVQNGLKSGKTTLEYVDVAGYNVGSGNYFAIFIPCDTSLITTVNSVKIVAGVVYTANSRYDVTNMDASWIVKNKLGIHLEVPYSTTQTPNISITAVLRTLEITCS